MAKKSKTPTQDPVTSEETRDPQALSKLKTQAFDAIVKVRNTWDDKERMLTAQQADSFSRNGSTRSKVTDAHISTLVFERQSRVAAQVPSGKVYCLDGEDPAGALMNFVRNKYYIPNANKQMPYLMKLRTTGVLSSTYGVCPVLVDYRADDEYVGPDWSIIPIRNFLPQPGKNSIQDSDWCMVSVIVSAGYLKSRLGKKFPSWNDQAINELLDKTKNGSSPSINRDANRRSAVEVQRENGTPLTGKGDYARIELVTMYERGKSGHWITFAPDHTDVPVLRDIPNPHKNGKIPIILRQCFPLIDSIYGLGDFERGITLQKAKDSLINLYLDAVKLSIFPPMKMDTNNVTPSTIRMEAGAKWLMKNMNAVEPYEANPQGMETFQSTYQFLTGALLNQFGTTDTQQTARSSSDPAFGRTPQALQALESRENARDNWDRFMLEQFVQELDEMALNLIGEKQSEPIDFHIFDEEIEDLQKNIDLEDIDDYMAPVNSSVARVSIPAKILKGNYKFQIDANSSTTDDQNGQVQALTEILELYLNPTNKQALDAAFQAEGMVFKPGQAFKQYVINSGVQDWDEIIEENDDNPAAGVQMPQFNDPMIHQVAQQLFGQQGQPPQPPVQQAQPQQPMQAQPAMPMPQQPMMPQQPQAGVPING